jgi:hypothetical protein
MTGPERLAAAAVVAGLLTACGSDDSRHRAGEANRDSAEATASGSTASGSTAGGATGTATSGSSTAAAAGDSWSPTGEVTVAGITADPSKHEGRHVTVRTNVAALVGRHGFTVVDTPKLHAPGGVGSGPGEVVTSPAHAPHSPSSDGLLVLAPAQPVELRDLLVSGTVRRFEKPEQLQRGAPWLRSASRAEIAQYQDRPVILVDSIRTADGRELMSPGTTLPAAPGDPESDR